MEEEKPDIKLYIFNQDELRQQMDFSESVQIMEHLSDKLNLPIECEKKPDEHELALCLDEQGIFLCKNNLSLRGDFTKNLKRIKQSSVQKELLIRAAKIKNHGENMLAIDATAGMGEDSFLLAAAGFTVLLYEYNTVIAALLQDALLRAKKNPELACIVNRMHFFEGDSLEAMKNMDTTPDVILLDPMFPARQKSALVKKKFQLLQQLEQPCTAEDELLQAAITAHPHKIVIKRPPKGPFLAQMKPSYSIEGKGIRYDCIVLV